MRAILRTLNAGNALKLAALILIGIGSTKLKGCAERLIIEPERTAQSSPASSGSFHFSSSGSNSSSPAAHGTSKPASISPPFGSAEGAASPASAPLSPPPRGSGGPDPSTPPQASPRSAAPYQTRPAQAGAAPFSFLTERSADGILSDYADTPPSSMTGFRRVPSRQSNTGSAAKAQPPAAPESAQQEPVPESAEEQTGVCTTLLDTPPRGIACLHCMQPEAQTQAEALISILLNSCLRNIAINYLVDGSFTFNEQVVHNHLAKLSTEGRRVLVEFYLSNGPRQRRWDSEPSTAFAGSIQPERFRERIRNDERLQEGYMNIVRRMEPTIQYALSLGAEVLLVPALEDNLSDEAFEQMNRLTIRALDSATAAAVRTGRSACPRCYNGNESSVPPGVVNEEHVSHPYFNTSGGLITNDGTDWALDASTADWLRVPTLRDLAAVRDAAANHNNVFILWTAAYQGLAKGFRGGGRYLAPEERTYAMPEPDEAAAIIAFLRAE